MADTLKLLKEHKKVILELLFADWVKKNTKDTWTQSETSICVIVWKWSEETLMQRSLLALLENFRRFNFCRVYSVPPLLTKPIYVFSVDNIAMYFYNLYRQTLKYCGLLSFLKVSFISITWCKTFLVSNGDALIMWIIWEHTTDLDTHP